ncbi:hypothetical protein [Roseateles sp.]|uniref:hypothetical protein n=1 Tax=Roseateles sp. TaxID=1971397 RepID=UPI0031DE272A
MPTTEPAIIARDRPLSERTTLERRNLVIAAAAGLTLNAGSVGELLGFPKAIADPDLAKGAFFIAIAYLLVMFLAGFIKDWMTWKVARDIKAFSGGYPAFLRAYSAIYATYGLGASPTTEMQEILTALQQTEVAFGKADAASRVLGAFDTVRVYLLDLLVPLMLAILALWQLHGFVEPFLAKVLA